MSARARGLVLNERFRAYLQRFRERYPLDVDLADKHGWLTETEPHSTVMTQTHSGGYGGSA